MAKQVDQLLPDQPRRPANIPTHLQSTNGQLQALIAIADHLAPYILGIQNPLTGDKLEGHPEADGGAGVAASVTFCKVCDRIDRLLAEEKRWTLEPYDTLAESLQAIYVTQKAALDAQVTAYKEALRPCIQLKATIFRIAGTNVWACAFGGAAGHPPLSGEGNTPEEAAADFDRKYHEGLRTAVDPSGGPGSSPTRNPQSESGPSSPNGAGGKHPPISPPKKGSRNRKRKTSR